MAAAASRPSLVEEHTFDENIRVGHDVEGIRTMLAMLRRSYERAGCVPFDRRDPQRRDTRAGVIRLAAPRLPGGHEG